MFLGDSYAPGGMDNPRLATVKGVVGTWISLASYAGDGSCEGFATGCIGQNGLKPDTWYRAENCRLVEAPK